jgi:hypothetical protein
MLTVVVAGATVSIPLRVNTGPQTLGSVDLSLFYNPDHLEPLSVVEGSDWPSSSQLVGTLNNPPGEVLLGGALTGNGISGTVHVATISFAVKQQAIDDENVQLFGRVNTMATPSGTLIGLEGRSFVAGSIAGLFGPQRRRRRSTLPSLPVPQRSRRAICDSPPCSDSECVGILGGRSRETGDADGNCIFDVRDVKFTMEFIVFASTGFATAEAQAFQGALLPGGVQEAAMDVDSNAVVDGKDSSLLLRVNFRQMRFVASLDTTSVSAASSCTFALTATLVDKGDTPADASQTFVYFDVRHPEPQHQAYFDQSVIDFGSVAPVQAQSGTLLDTTSGSIWKAEETTPGSGVFMVVARTGLSLSNVGVSLIVVTTDATGVTNVARQFFLDGGV